MTRKKSNVKALALAVTCAILAGGGIGLEPVYAADVTYDTSTNQLKNGATAIDTLTVGGVTISGSGTTYGITIGDVSKHVMISDHDISATGSVSANIIASGIDARMEGGKVVAQNGLYIGYDGTDITQATYDNSRFAINGENGSFRAANGKFTVSSGGAITADSLALTGTDGTTNVGAAIKDNANNIQAVNGQVTNVKNDVSGLQTATGQLQTKVDELTAMDTAARNDITSLQIKTAGISADGSEITTNSLKLRESDSSDTHEITAAKVKGYDKAVAAVGDTSTEGTLAYNTQKIRYADDDRVLSDKATYIDGITHAGDVRLANGEVRAKSIVLEEKFADGTSAQATLTRESIVNLHGMIDGKTKIKVADGSEVGGVTFDQGKVTNVKSINDKLEFADDGIYLNKGDQAKQIKIGTDGKIIIGTSSSAYDTNGFYAGGDDYTKAKAAIDGINGKIKGANGAFGVDENGNVTTTGDIKGKDITASGKLTVDSDATVGGDLTVTKNIKGQSLNIGVDGSEFTVDAGGNMTSKSAKIGSVGIDNTGAITGVTSLTTDALTVTGAFTTGGDLTVTGDLNATGAINGKTISITEGGSIAGVSFATGGNLTATTGTIGGVSFATGGVVSGVNNFTSSRISDGQGTVITNGNVESKTAKIGAIRIDNEKIESTSANGLTIENVKINDGVVSDVTSLTANSATIGGVNTLDNTGITVATGKKIQVGSKTVIEDGSIAVSTNTKLTDQALTLNTTNTWTAAGGLVADKATVNGVVLGADATKGKATFTDANGKVTTISGDTITTGTITAGELLVDSISLGKDPTNKNITIGSNGDIKTNGDITVTGTDGDTTVIDGAQATFGKDAMNQTIINKGDISATAKNAADAQQSTLTHNNKGFKVAGKDAGGTKDSSFGFDTSTGIGTFTGQDSTTTAINGSNLTLTNGANSTALTAGGATFTGAAGDSSLHGTETKIDGGIITTDTLNVERINLGENILDTNGTPHGSNLSMDKQGNFSAAGGNFKVTGGTGADKGAFTNTVGNTTLQTDTNGASMKYNNGTVESNVSVGDNSAMISAGASSIEVKNDGITNNGKTTFKGAVDATVPTTETTINGNTITTGHLITDKLTITGSGAAAGTGSGSIAFGGDGSITSNIKDAATGKEATFKTDETGTFTEAKDIDGNKTTNTVNAKGNTNVVTDGTNTSTATQTATSIGGVVTNGTVTMKQELTADGLKLEQTGYDEVNIAKGDVTVKNNRNTANPNQEVHLSDLGSLNNLDGELAARDEYQDNKTAVGAINAEAGIRREEVARLDNRIDDVNNRVDKVGAMAAAIASLKSIGYDPQAPSEFSIGLGQYKGETGVAMGFFHYPNKNFMINVSLSTAGGETMGGIGATWRFGHKSPQKLLEEQREAQAKKELAAAEKYQAAAKLAKEAQERAEYAAKLARQAQVSADNAKAAADATQAKHFGE